MADFLTDDELTELRHILDEVEGHEERLSSKAESFIVDQRVRLEKYGAATRLSPAQWKWLRDIYEQVTSL